MASFYHAAQPDLFGGAGRRLALPAALGAPLALVLVGGGFTGVAGLPGVEGLRALPLGGAPLGESRMAARKARSFQ